MIEIVEVEILSLFFISDEKASLVFDAYNTPAYSDTVPLRASWLYAALATPRYKIVYLFAQNYTDIIDFQTGHTIY